ncbi:MAG: PilZ domain-containing protein [Nitrospirota bacterium]|nr:PilZ domain-containing protein [Nitrospirota bacterium]
MKIMNHDEGTSLPSTSAALRVQPRLSERHLLEIPVDLGPFEECATTDISADGVGLRAPTPLPVGVPLGMEFQGPHGHVIKIGADVVYCISTEDGSHQVGLKLTSVREWERSELQAALRAWRETPGTGQEARIRLRPAAAPMTPAATQLARRPTNGRHPRPTARTSGVYASTAVGWGAYLPPHIITNEDINRSLRMAGQPTRFGDVVGIRTGIETRRYADSQTYPSDLALEAARRALRQAQVQPEQLDTIIFCGVDRDMDEPATGCILQEKLGASNAYAFDLTNACNGFLSGLDQLDSNIASGRTSIGLVAVGEVISQHVTWDAQSKEDLKRSAMGYTLGDGGGAVVLRRPRLGERPSIQGSCYFTDGSYWPVAVVPAVNAEHRLFKSNAAEIERAAVDYIPHAVREVLAQVHWTIDDVDWFVPHQVGKHVIHALFFDKLGVPPHKLIYTFPHHGNVGAASMPIALCEAQADGRICHGDRLVFVGGSGGFGVAIVALIF